MPTSKLDRLNKLFEGDKRIAQVGLKKPQIPDLDFPYIAPNNRQATLDGAPAEESSGIPQVALYPRKITPTPPPPGPELALTTGSDKCEYLATFPSKPSPKKPLIKFRSGGKSEGGFQGSAPKRENLTASANELCHQDVDGNALTGHFCPLALVAKFPYKYMVDTNDRVSRHFFAHNKFYERKWDIYYIDPPESMMAKPILLLPLSQVKDLIEQINLQFELDMECPPDPFIVSFFNDGMPQPTRLGTSRSREDLADLEASIPNVPDDHANEVLRQEDTVKPTERSFTEFKAKIERIFASKKKSKQAAKNKKTNDRFLMQQDCVRQLKQAQRYLGLRPKATKLSMPGTASSWPEQQRQHEQDFRVCGIHFDPLDIRVPAPYAFEKDPIIVCIDVEAYERDHRRITEVGVSTLDTLDLAGIAPGDGGENWIAHIRSRHFRIRGTEHLENKDFCPGDANNFQFGKSEWVSLNTAAEAVDKCFQYPFSAQFKYREGNGRDCVDIPTGLSSTDAQKGPKGRNIIFLGHDIRHEFEYLRQLGSQIFNPSRATHSSAAMEIQACGTAPSETLTSIIEALDTVVLYKVLVRETQNQSLGKMMHGLGRTAWHLHNAGNDARYTLEALIALSIKARLLEDKATVKDAKDAEKEDLAGVGSTTASLKDEVESRVEENQKAVDQGIRDEAKKGENDLHTMTITDNLGKQAEVEDPWLLAQVSD